MAYLLLLAMTYLGAQASVFFKRLAGESNILGILSSPYLYLGGGLYLIAALLNIYVLSLMEYSKVLPLTSLTYGWTMLLSYLVFKEKINIQKIVGLLFVIAGAIMIVSKEIMNRVLMVCSAEQSGS